MKMEDHVGGLVRRNDANRNVLHSTADADQLRVLLVGECNDFLASLEESDSGGRRIDLRRNLVESADAHRILDRHSGDGHTGVYSAHRHRAGIGLNAGSAAGVGSGDGQCPNRGLSGGGQGQQLHDDEPTDRTWGNGSSVRMDSVSGISASRISAY